MSFESSEGESLNETATERLLAKVERYIKKHEISLNAHGWEPGKRGIVI